MVTEVSVGDRKIRIVPRVLQDYLDKVDYIKSRREDPWALLRGLPAQMNANDYTSFVEIAMSTCHLYSSSVTQQEEQRFDDSLEGLLFSLACGIAAAERSLPQQGNTYADKIRPKRLEIDVWKRRVSDALKLWREASTDERNQIQAALSVSDTRNAVKKSDGPPENEAAAETGQKQSV